MKETKLKPHQFAWVKYLICLWYVSTIVFVILFVNLKNKWLLLGIVAMIIIGIFYKVVFQKKIRTIKNISNMIEEFINKNNLCQFHYEVKHTLFGEKEVKVLDYYPQITYKSNISSNVFRLRFRLDGSSIAQKFRDLEQPLSDMFCTISTDIIETRGYITYCFELEQQEQMMIESENDIFLSGKSEIVFSKDIVWDWKKTPHLLLTGTTGSGKTVLCQYIITCLINQGVRVIYLDPKNDDDMRLFAQSKPALTYATKENEIAKLVRETEEEVRSREKELKNIGIEEAEFNPVFLMFDELIAFSKTASKKTYEETAKRLATIVVTGRSKRIYAGMILQRPDTSFVEGAIRDNLCCRICMGKMSDTAYKMSFGTDFAHIRNYRNEIGAGLIYRQGVDTKPREFIAPFIKQGVLSR